jgi:dynein heavy chain 1, cytosolic
VHLAPRWLSELEKKLFRLTPNPLFRLFLSMEFNPNVPGSLIKQSFKIVYEPPSGIKSSLLRTYKTVFSADRSNRAPNERARLHFLVAWLHAVIIERQRYIPLGWSKKYEFNEADQRCSLDLIDELIDAKCG